MQYSVWQSRRFLLENSIWFEVHWSIFSFRFDFRYELLISSSHSWWDLCAAETAEESYDIHIATVRGIRNGFCANTLSRCVHSWGLGYENQFNRGSCSGKSKKKKKTFLFARRCVKLTAGNVSGQNVYRFHSEPFKYPMHLGIKKIVLVMVVSKPRFLFGRFRKKTFVSKMESDLLCSFHYTVVKCYSPAIAVCW